MYSVILGKTVPTNLYFVSRDNDGCFVAGPFNKKDDAEKIQSKMAKGELTDESTIGNCKRCKIGGELYGGVCIDCHLKTSVEV